MTRRVEAEIDGGASDDGSRRPILATIADWCGRHLRQLSASVFTVGTAAGLLTWYSSHLDNVEAAERELAIARAGAKQAVRSELAREIAAVSDMLAEIKAGFEAVRRPAVSANYAMISRNFEGVADGYERIAQARRRWHALQAKHTARIHRITACRTTGADADRDHVVETVFGGRDAALEHYARRAPRTRDARFEFAEQVDWAQVDGAKPSTGQRRCADRYLWRQRQSVGYWDALINDPSLRTPNFVSVGEVFSFIEHSVGETRHVDVADCQGDIREARAQFAEWIEHDDACVWGSGERLEPGEAGDTTGGVPVACEPDAKLTHAEMCDEVHRFTMEGVRGIDQARFEVANLHLMLGLTILAESVPFHLRDLCYDRAATIADPDPREERTLDPAFCDDTFGWAVPATLGWPVPGTPRGAPPSQPSNVDGAPALVAVSDGIDAASVTGSTQ